MSAAVRARSDFDHRDSDALTISGNLEGMFLWLALEYMLKPPTSDRDDPQSFTLIPTEGAELFEDLKSLRSKALAKKEEVDVSMAEVQSLEGCVLPFCFVYFLRI